MRFKTDNQNTAPLAESLKNAIDLSGAPGAVVNVGNSDGTLFYEAAGSRQLEPRSKPALKDTLYDLASLTKVVATTNLALMLSDEGLLDLDASITDHLPLRAFSGITPRHLLTHTSGLAADDRYYLHAESTEQFLQLISDNGVQTEPGVTRRYSDAGFIVLGKVIEIAAMDTLGALCQKHVFTPLGMRRTAFNPPARWRINCAATEKCLWRKRMMIGEVHDENAYAVGGVAGHAGLFSTADDLALFCRALLNGKLITPDSMQQMLRIGQVASYPWQGLGWQLDPWPSGESGFLPSRTAFGHTGWTGTSIYIDPGKDLYAILLSNTCHPTREKRDSETLRRAFYSGVARAYYSAAVNVHSGLDRLLWEGFTPVSGKKVAILTNHAAVDQLNRKIRDVFDLSPDVQVVRLFTPEHGYKADVERGVAVDSEDGVTPIVSLYGKRNEPTADELRDVDVFISDLPDIGSRYFTYMATMKACMKACETAQVEFLVLDRPNPIGGETIEGPIAQDTGSKVCCAAIPARHGMTMGELALFFKETECPKLKLTVSMLDSWHSGMMLGQCDYPWIPPSPNIPDWHTALLYAGNCLLEGTNLNEGRGTETPFKLLGAPWINSEAIIKRILTVHMAGCVLTPATYTPRSIPVKASSPRFEDEQCHGIRIEVIDAQAIRPFSLTIAVLCAIHAEHPDKLELNDFFDRLAGVKNLRQQILAGHSADNITHSWQEELAAFDAVRPRLYPKL